MIITSFWRITIFGLACRDDSISYLRQFFPH